MSGLIKFPPDLLPGAERNVSGRELRRHLERVELAQKAQGEAVTTIAGPAIEKLLGNQHIMKAHIEQLEAWRNRGFWGRWTWLVTGR